MILGITDSADSEAYWSESARRMVFYQYPQGPAPLTGLLSMIDDQGVDKPKFGWWEERMEMYSSVTADASGASGGPFDTGSGSDETDPFSAAVGDTLRIYVADASKFRKRDVIWMKDAQNSSAANIQIRGILTADPNTTDDYITMRVQTTITNAANDATNIGITVYAVSTASGEGERSSTGGHYRPMEVENFTQILRTPYSLTRTALKTGVRYDQDGDHRTKAKQAGLRHAIMQEQMNFHGVRGEQTITNTDGESVQERTAGGIRWFLEQWELGNTANGGKFDYRPGGANLTTTAWDGDDDKRILEINSTIAKTQWNEIWERAFRRTNEENFSKVCFCGSGFLSVFNDFVDNTSVAKRNLFSSEKAGFNFTEWESPHGTVYFKTHPLMNEHNAFQHDAFILDMGNLKYTYLNDSDTTLLENRQDNDADKRKDEWMTECSLELRFPESHMFIEGLNGITS